MQTKSKKRDYSRQSIREAITSNPSKIWPLFGKRKGTNLACDVSDAEFLNARRDIYKSDLKDGAPGPCKLRITTEDIIEQIRKTKAKRAPGLDGIHNSITKADPENIARWIKRIYK